MRVSFISDERETERGFHLTWRGNFDLVITSQYLFCHISRKNQFLKIFVSVSLPTTKALQTTTYKVKTTFKKMDLKTTALQQKTTSLSSSQGKWL